MYNENEEIEKALALVRSLEQERSSWEDTWREIRDYIYPHSGLALDAQNGQVQGHKRYDKVLDSYPEKAVRVLAAGMLGGMVSPSRMWFQLGIKDLDGSNLTPACKKWLAHVRDTLLHFYNQADIYGAMHLLFREMALYGQGVMLIENDVELGFNFTPLSCGEYYLDQNDKGEVDTLLRKVFYSPRQLIQRFGENNVSMSVLEAADNMQIDKRYEVLHIIRPNLRAVHGETVINSQMLWESLYILRSGGDGTRILRRSGFRNKPFVAPRWERMNGSPYGHSPARTALADVKTLYEIDKQNLTTLKKNAAPPVTVKGNMKNQLIDLSPNGVTYVPAMNADAGVSPIYQPQNSYQMTEAKLDKLQQSIREVFYNDLFMPIMQRDKSMSATEINSINAEKMSNITPVIELLEKEALDHIFKRCFSILIDFGDVITQPPQELLNKDIQIEYISVLAQAQKISELGSIEQFISFAASCAAHNPQVLDQINIDKVVTRYGGILSVDGELFNSQETINKIRSERQALTQQEKVGKELQQVTIPAMKTLSETDPEGIKNIISTIKQ